MLLDTIHGTIERRILLNYRIELEVLQKILPSGFRPKLFKGKGIGGVCMIRFGGLRPRKIPKWLGFGSENAAHRIAVEWDQEDGRKEGVFIPRRDTGSRMNKTLGGRVFPGIFEKSVFTVAESPDSISVKIQRADGTEEVSFAGHVADRLPISSCFESTEEAASFFSLGATGYSATLEAHHYHGMELRSLNWKVEPMQVTSAYSSFYSDPNYFPQGSVELDCALVMRNIEHEWHSRPDLYFDRTKERLSVNKPK
jgi:Uncharacterized conserved protein (COG2071)